MRSTRWLGFVVLELCALVTLEAAGHPQFVATSIDIPGLASVPALSRSALVLPVRYRAIVLPGSGCGGLAPIADQYFSGLLHAEILVIQKPGTNLDDWPPPKDCSDSFIRGDNHSSWANIARSALAAQLVIGQRKVEVPQLLIGISEGAELVLSVAPVVTNLAGLVLVSGSGLDPWLVGHMQSERLGHQSAWQSLGQILSSDALDQAIVQGRSFRYWRDLWQWKVEEPLIASPWSILQVWGDLDELIPTSAYQAFSRRIANRVPQSCSIQFAAADHSLQRKNLDGIQRTWAWLESWARNPNFGLCVATPKTHIVE